MNPVSIFARVSDIDGPANLVAGSRAEWWKLVLLFHDPLPDEACLLPDTSELRHHLCIPDRQSVCSADRGCRMLLDWPKRFAYFLIPFAGCAANARHASKSSYRRRV